MPQKKRATLSLELRIDPLIIGNQVQTSCTL